MEQKAKSHEESAKKLQDSHKQLEGKVKGHQEEITKLKGKLESIKA